MTAGESCGCGGSDRACVFASALQARATGCELARRICLAERELLECGSPVARINCETLAALLRERSRFALRLPAPGRPLMHAQVLRLQCGGLTALQSLLGGPADVHRLVMGAQAVHGSLADLPWGSLVPAIAAWRLRPRARPARPGP